MKRELFTTLSLFLCNLLFGQLTLDHSFSCNDCSGSGVRYQIGYLPDYDYVIYQQESVYQYDEITQSNTVIKNKIKIYDFSYNLIKEIDLSPLGNNYWTLQNYNFFDKRFNIGITQYLFNKDSKIELVLTTNDSKIYVYNEDLKLIQVFLSHGGSSMVLIELNDQIPIYKLKVEEFDFYNVEGNPFATSATSYSNTIEKHVNSLFAISPNPSDGVFTARISQPMKGRIIICDSNGLIIKQIEINESNIDVPINLINVSDGIYFCQLITSNNEKSTLKIIKE
jgi:hypothetical protein